MQATGVRSVDYDTDAGNVRSFRLAADESGYGAGTFGVAAWSVR